MGAPSIAPPPSAPPVARSVVTDMRSALVDAALTVLHRDGAAGLTVRSITHEAGCSTTGIYTYFGGKDGLVEAVFLAGFESFDAAVRPGLTSGDLVAAGHAYRRWALAHRTQYMVMFGRAVPEYVPSDAARQRARSSFARLAEGVRRAGAGDDHVERAYHLFATVHGHVMLEMAGMVPASESDAEARFDRALRSLGRP